MNRNNPLPKVNAFGVVALAIVLFIAVLIVLTIRGCEHAPAIGGTFVNTFVSGCVESYHARQHRDGTGCCDPAVGFLDGAKAAQAVPLVAPTQSRVSVRPAHEFICPVPVLVESLRNGGDEARESTTQDLEHRVTAATESQSWTLSAGQNTTDTGSCAMQPVASCRRMFETVPGFGDGGAA
jgi:hypothetical protein